MVIIFGILVLLLQFDYINTFHYRHNGCSRRNGQIAVGSVLSSPVGEVEYDTELITNYYNAHPGIVWERLVQVGSPLLGWWLARKWDNITSSFRTGKENEIRLNQRAEDLKDCIVQGRSICFIKFGQAASLRQDLLKSSEYVRELSKLQDEVGTFNNDAAMNIIRTELGRDPHEIFEFDPRHPIASASIGQVYKARLRSSGATVAVKVQRPDAQSTVPLDMYILRRLAAFVRKQKKLRSDLEAIADEFGRQLYNEINYEQEAANCHTFRKLYGDIPNIFVPACYDEYTTRKVLTMEFVEGEKGPWKQDGERLLTVGLRCSVLQLLESGFFHGDPHRGNLLRTPDGNLAYLDFGMMSSVSDANRYALIGTVLGLVNKDFELVIDNLKILDVLPDETKTDVVVDALSEALYNSTMTPGSTSSLNFTRLNQNLESISYLLPFRLPPFYTLIVRSLTILEGLALDVDPDFRLIKGAYPFVAKQIIGNTSPSPELIALIHKVILTENGRIRWNKLESFVSLAGSADKALAGNFQALKDAQEKSDLRRTYGAYKQGTAPKMDSDPQVSVFSIDLLNDVLDFLLAEQGKFLREPLIDEIAETTEALGLTAVALASLATGNIVPSPQDKPDQELVERFLVLCRSLLMSNSNSHDSSQNTNSGVINVVDSFLEILRDQNSIRKRTEELRPLLGKARLLVVALVSRLLERTARRVTSAIVSEGNIKSLIEIVSR